MVALNEKYHHNGTAARSNRCQAGKSWESEKSVDIPISVPSDISVAIQHPPRSSAASLCKSVNPCGPIFCGHRYDPEGPGYYVRNRNYMPFLGRWLQRDPIGYAGGVNLYEYVGGRVLEFLDPDGTSYCDDLNERIAEYQRDIEANITAAMVHTYQLLLTKGNWERAHLVAEIAGEDAEAALAKAALDVAKSIYDLFCDNPTGGCPIIIPDGSPSPVVDW